MSASPIRDTLRVDVPSAATTFQWYAETIDKTYGEVGPTGPDALSLVTREPIGVVAAIVPWNYPLIITAWKLGAALATGNSVVLKPASQSPLTALRLAELATEAGLPDGVLNVVPGPGRRARSRPRPAPGRRQDRLHRLDRRRPLAPARDRRHGAQGRHAGGSAGRVRRSCSATSATSRRRHPPSAGGSSTTAARRATRARGSSCIGRSATSSSHASRRSGATLAPGDPLDPRTKLGPIVDARQLEKVLGYVALGETEGARLVTGGRARAARRPVASTFRRRSSMASTTAGVSPARRSSDRSSP